MVNGQKLPKGFFIAMGIIIGTVIGALAGNVGLWIVIGLVAGAAAEYSLSKTNPSK
jgi:hypothetical protein|tara:strand:- start:386 stop:553 length:168 start_codon:yes stop_codon:yes gene_type:complete